jgi:hypothetical protein
MHYARAGVTLQAAGLDLRGGRAYLRAPCMQTAARVPLPAYDIPAAIKKVRTTMSQILLVDNELADVNGQYKFAL